MSNLCIGQRSIQTTSSATA